MRVLLAFDKFKHALTALQACEAAAAALRARHPEWELDLCPLTDGGDGFCASLTHAADGRFAPTPVRGPRGRRVEAAVGLVDWNRIPAAARTRLGGRAPAARPTVGVVELAAASGVALLSRSRRDPWRTTTFGTGDQMRRAIELGAGSLLLGIGGSATNDLGLGALAALGFRFLDARGEPVAIPTPSTWARLCRIEPGPAQPPIHIACDVTNPLLGPQGATAIYGPQKGLQPEDYARLEEQMARLAALLCEACGQPLSLAEIPGTGAAGGIGFGLMVAFGARLVPGFELVSDWLDLGPRLARADLVITGEGRFDATSLTGKGPGTLVAEARRLGKPVHVFAGSLGVPADRCTHAVSPAGMPLAEALRRSAELLGAAVARAL
jgi:glycerate kinase